MKPSVRANLEMMWHVALRLGGLRDRRSWGLVFIRNRFQGKTGGSRPARRLTFCRPPKSKQKSASPGGGHSFRAGQEVSAVGSADKRPCAPLRGSNCPGCCRLSAVHPTVDVIRSLQISATMR